MMKFKDIPYKRPTVEEVNTTRLKQLEKFKNATTLDGCIEAYREIENYTYDVIYTMWNLAYIRHSMDKRDEYYAAENDYWGEAGPEMELSESEITKALMQSTFRAGLEKEFGELSEDSDMPSPFVAGNLKLIADEAKKFLQKMNLFEGEKIYD